MTEPASNLTTRPLMESDFPRVVDIDAAITGRNRPGFFEKRLQAALAEPKHFIYIGCEQDGELVGFLMARLLEGEYGQKENVAVLDVIDVDPAVQGKGAGRALMQAAHDHCRGLGASRVDLMTAVTNTSAQPLYESMGYEREEAFYTYSLEL